jgi:uncharacterized protein (TIGR03663 family)
MDRDHKAKQDRTEVDARRRHQIRWIKPMSIRLPASPLEVIPLDGRVWPAIRGFASQSISARWVLFVLLAFLGLALRLPRLSLRPMHTDEAVNAYIVGQLLKGDAFAYEGQDRHGPALVALALPLVRLQGAKKFSDLTESELRLATVLAGILTIMLFGSAVEKFGFGPCLIAAIIFAVAPLPVYYNRYFIHESLFVAFTFGFILAGWRACESKSVCHGVLAGGFAALMLTCKETAVLHFVAVVAAAFICGGGRNYRKDFAGVRMLNTVVLAAASFLVVDVLLFTWFGRQWTAMASLMHAIPRLLLRATGQGHEKPFWYYAKLLTGGWSGEVIGAVACFGLFLALRKGASCKYRFLAFYTIFIVSFYSSIPYKTPWLALNFWPSIALFFGLAVVSLWRLPLIFALNSAVRAFSIRTILVAGLSTAAVLIMADTWERVFLHPFDEPNPYAYVHTSDDLFRLPVEIEQLAREEAIMNPRIDVIAADPWPLPWYLRRFSETGFWQPGQQVGTADFYITSTEAATQYADELKNFHPEFFGVRPGVLIILWSPTPK